MTSYPLDFTLKGSRSYIHGPDIFNACIAVLGKQGIHETTTIDFTLQKTTGSNLIAVVSDEAPDASNPLSIGNLKCQTPGGKSYGITLIQGTTLPQARMLYDESWIAGQCNINLEHRHITLPKADTDYSHIEVIISMTKALHLNLFPDLKRRWVFCRWSGPYWPLSDRLDGLSLQLKQAVGTRLTRTEATLQNEVVGNIYFSAR